MATPTIPAPPIAPPSTRIPFPLAAAAFTANFDRFALGPILVTVAAALRVPLASTAALAGGYSLAYGLSQPLWGVLSDRLGRVRVVRAALAVAALAGLASAFAPNLAVLAALRVLVGFVFGAVVPSALSFVGDAVAPRYRQSVLTDLMAALGLGSGLAALFGGVVAHWISWRLVFAVPALVAATAAFGLRGVAEPPRAAVGTMADQLMIVARTPFAYVVSGLGIVEGAVLLAGLTFIAPALQHQGLSAAAAGAVTALYGAGTLVFTRVVKALTSRIPASALAAIGGALVCTGYISATAAPSVWTYALAATLLGAGWAFLHSTLQAWATSVAPDARGTAVSFYVAALFIGSSLGTTLFGGAADQGRFGTIFGSAAVATVPLTVATVIGRARFTAHD